MTLKNVKCFGTEGRRLSQGAKEIPPNDTIHATAKFRVDLVKTFKIVSKQDEEETEIDPALVEVAEAKKKDDWAIGTKVVKSKENDKKKFNREFDFDNRKLEPEK